MPRQKVQEIEVRATKHRWQIATDTGWVHGHWAITEQGLLYQLRGALRACGVPVEIANVRVIVDNARKEGYVRMIHHEDGP